MGKVVSVTIVFGFSLIASAQPVFPVRDLVVYAAVISVLGGVASGVRQTRDWYVLLQYGLNTAVLGVSLVLMSRYWIGDDESASYAALGGVGVLSLGGLATVDWATGTLKKWIAKRSKRDDPEKDNASKK